MFDRLKFYCAVSRKSNQPCNLKQHPSDCKKYYNEFVRRYPDFVDKPLTVQFGDNIAKLDVPTIVKSRRVGDENGVLLPLNRQRHWGITPNEVSNIDIEWGLKRQAVVWRGATTGKPIDGPFSSHPRTLLVKRWARHADPNINVGYSKVVQNKDQLLPLVKNVMDIEDQLKYAYIVSVEGNDVATNLKWILASNSVPIMPKPRYETWLMESRLQPYVHYVPVNWDFSNLADVLKWCKLHQAKCQTIAKNGQIYISPFFKDETALETAVLNRYLGGI